MKIDKNTPIRHQNMNAPKIRQQDFPRNNNIGVKTPEAMEKASDIGAQKVQNANAKRSNNIYNRIKSRMTTDNSSQDDNSTSSSTFDDEVEETKKKVARKVIISILLILAPIFALLFFVVIVFSVIENNFPLLVSILFDQGKTEEIQNISDSVSEQEKAYYNKLSEKKNNYVSKCGSEFNVNLVHASLIYLYYQDNYSNVDYNSMGNMLDSLYNTLSSSCGMDDNIGGKTYNILKNNTDFNNYYSELLKKKNMDEILQEIFNLSKMMYVDTSTQDYIPEDATINIDERTGTSTGGTSINNSNNNQNVTNVSFKDYLLGVVYANVPEKDYSNEEKIKAHVVVYTSNALAKGSLSVDTQLIAINDPKNEMLYCNTDRGCSYVSRDNKMYLQVGGGSSGNGNNAFYNGEYYYHRQMDEAIKDNLSKIVDEVYGVVLLNKDGKYETVNPNKIGSSNDDYQKTLERAYRNFTVKNLREGNYVEGIDFYNQRVVIPTIAYDQSDYSNVRFCGRSGSLSSNSIASSGCGVTAIAIVISSYENDRRYDPIYMSEQARLGHNCGNNIFGTLPGIFWSQAEAHGHNVLNVGKSATDLNLVLNYLAAGNMVITNVGPGTFTRGGHYIVLTGIDSVNKKVYVTDPYDRGNKNSSRRSGSGWYDFNLIAREAYSFYIIERKK